MIVTAERPQQRMLLPRMRLEPFTLYDALSTQPYRTSATANCNLLKPINERMDRSLHGNKRRYNTCEVGSSC